MTLCMSKETESFGRDARNLNEHGKNINKSIKKKNHFLVRQIPEFKLKHNLRN